MAKDLDGLPDLGDLVLRGLRRLLRLAERLSGRSLLPRRPPPQPVGAGRVAPRPVTASPSPAPKTPLRSSLARRPAAAKTALAARLRERDFLRQAIVVNEILAKPVALRRRR